MDRRCVCVYVCLCEYERNVKEGLGVISTCVSVRVVSLELLLIGMFNVKGYVTTCCVLLCDM